jgi:hypothetical protein
MPNGTGALPQHRAEAVRAVGQIDGLPARERGIGCGELTHGGVGLIGGAVLVHRAALDLAAAELGQKETDALRQQLEADRPTGIHDDSGPGRHRCEQ